MLQVLVVESDCHAALADRRSDTFDRTEAHVPAGKDVPMSAIVVSSAHDAAMTPAATSPAAIPARIGRPVPHATRTTTATDNGPEAILKRSDPRRRWTRVERVVIPGPYHAWRDDSRRDARFQGDAAIALRRTTSRRPIAAMMNGMLVPFEMSR